MELGFEVDDIEAMKVHLAACGLVDFREERMGWGHALEINDLDGHRVVIYAFAPSEEADLAAEPAHVPRLGPSDFPAVGLQNRAR
jgi:hypothetical protein